MKILIMQDDDRPVAEEHVPDEAAALLASMFVGGSLEQSMSEWLRLTALNLRGALEQHHVATATRSAAKDFEQTWPKAAEADEVVQDGAIG